MEMEKCSKICSKLVANLGLKWEGVDWWWATRFVALAMEEEEMIAQGLADLIPQKRAKSRKKPTLLTVEDDIKKERWNFLNQQMISQMMTRRELWEPSQGV